MWFPSFLRSWTGLSAPNSSKDQRRQPARTKQTSARLQVEQLEHRWCPSYSLVTSRTALAGADSLNWGTLGPAGTVVANPSTILSTSGRSVSLSQPTQFGGFAIFEQTPPTTADSWNGSFAPGDMLLYGGNRGSKKSDPYTLNFGVTPIAAGGAQIESDYNGKFTAEVQALDAKGNVLASFTEVGNSTHAADNSAIFIGISSTSVNIYQIALSLTKAPSSTIGDFAINQFDFRTSAAAAAPAVRQLASAVGLAPLASSLPNAGQPALPTAPPPGPATLSASSISDEVPSATITQVAFYVSMNGTNTLLGYGAQSSTGVWTLTFTVNRTPGAYTLLAVAEDSDGVLGDPAPLTLSLL
jgi:hypothetical protein